MSTLDLNKASHQFVDVLLNHLYLCFAMLFVEFAFLSWSVGKSPVQEIISIITMLFYFCVIYVKSNDIALYDAKSYTSLKPDGKKPFLWAAGIIAITYILYGICIFIFKGTANCPSWIVAIVNLLFNLWTMPYMGIMGYSKGNIMWYSHIFFVLVPVLGMAAGYVAGMKKFFLGKWARRIMYKNEK